MSVDRYFLLGCGRCPKGGTPDCKALPWVPHMKLLRGVLLECGLTETIKWGVPCYTLDGANVLTLAALKDSAVIGFFKGSMMKDPHGWLHQAGENTRYGRQLKFTSLDEVVEKLDGVKEYVLDAIAVERSGAKVVPMAAKDLPIPEELTDFFEEVPGLEEAFFALTPGRQRGYLIHFNEPKQSATRRARIERVVDQILKGIGYHDVYKKNSRF